MVLTVGTFDGVHLGHRRVLEEIVTRARKGGHQSVLITFEPHPLEIVNPAAAPPRLTLADERQEVLAQSDLDLLVVYQFTRETSQLAPDEFIRRLTGRFAVRELVIGHDHGFGRGRAGDETTLRELGTGIGFAVDVVEPVSAAGRPVSSTLVRRAVAGGDLDMARRLLGRRYSFSASVVPGAGRGRDLGYRTINLALPDRRKLFPPDGVYAVEVEWATGSAGGMMHQGARPTFGETERSVEVHLLDVRADLYGKLVKVSWVQRLRDVMRFESPAALKAQLDKDFAAARTALTG